MNQADTIVAAATPPGVAALAVIRVSGKDCFPTVQKLVSSKNLAAQNTHTLHYTVLSYKGEDLDEVILSLFKGPRSYTGEDSIEISCHGSPFVAQKIIDSLQQCGARLAEPGEFTKRAFINGKLDLAQADAVADLIHSEAEAAHKAAMDHLKGNISKRLSGLREELISFASLIELELDFSEEDVEFADRTQLFELSDKIEKELLSLASTFKYGNAVKSGVNIALVGKPNAGKSTLLNALLQEEKAIVSAVPGTTRDYIEDELVIDGVIFKLIDTAGIRETEDEVELIGVQRSLEKIRSAHLVLLIVDQSLEDDESLEQQKALIKEHGKEAVLVLNKADLPSSIKNTPNHSIALSALRHEGLEELKAFLIKEFKEKFGVAESTVVTNVRHYDSLQKALEAIQKVKENLNTISGEFLAMDIRDALHHLGTITGEVTTDDLLGSIFSRFCIGK